MNTAPQIQTTKAPAAARAEELTEVQYEIVRAAVNMVRNQQIQRLDTLKERLKAAYPGQEDDIKKALVFWANYEVRSYNRNHH